ncbi:hypothetical protein [Nonomuraea sp. NEAU-A123]|uniref:hypothetical protein n=1 Tax=Nonomuraea sp. NEAU-A123 TaxID=2839649 RepID=UPI001BE3EA52|nr:hypothetical protein [Nonomuraea sp. NEAU-A123]MBT2225151.1 hypothetical protein [Nonomuraea sp. NEAU-A123]
MQGRIARIDDQAAALRLRRARPTHGIPVLTEAAAMIASYLNDECEMGRIAADADVDAVVTTIIADVMQRRLL